MTNKPIFSSERLSISPMPSFYHFPAEADTEGSDKENALLAEMMALLTLSTTAYLPPSWREVNSLGATKSWSQQRSNEGGFFGIRLNTDNRLMGLVFLSPVTAGKAEMHIGYLLDESIWGQGYGSELICALIAWASQEPQIRTLIAGVEADNLASIAILEKNGFQAQTPTKAKKAAAAGTLFLQRHLRKA